MNSFSIQWLRLREPFDRAARAQAAASLDLAGWACSLPRRGASLQVLDLGCGSGANLRVLAPLLGRAQQWQVFDHDDALLATWPQELAAWAGLHGHALAEHAGRIAISGAGFDASVQRHAVDLAGELSALPWHQADLVSASALLDLVSLDWLTRLVDHCAAAGASAMLAMSVDGRTRWSPADADDAWVHDLYGRHQRRDKGFGPALGPDAPAAAATLFERAGYRVRAAESDWRLNDPTMLLALIDGISAAAIEQQPKAARRVREWRQRRAALASASSLQLGHRDLIAFASRLP